MECPHVLLDLSSYICYQCKKTFSAFSKNYRNDISFNYNYMQVNNIYESMYFCDIVLYVTLFFHITDFILSYCLS